LAEFVANSPYEWKDVLTTIKHFLQDEWENFERIRIVHRCANCFKKTSEINLHFREKQTIIEQWSYNCNTETESKNTITIDTLKKENILFSIHKNEFNFGLQLKLMLGISLECTIPFTSFFDNEDYKIHGEYAYKNRHLHMIQRSIGDRNLVLMLQDFIDFKGLMPYYNQTIHLTFKEMRDEDDQR
jgi:hypothetical protein